MNTNYYLSFFSFSFFFIIITIIFLYIIESEPEFQYIITLTTGSKKVSGALHLTMFGLKHSSVKLVLRHGDIETGSSVTFHTNIKTDLGTIEKLSTQSTGDEPRWFCEKITVNCVTTGKHASSV